MILNILKKWSFGPAPGRPYPTWDSWRGGGHIPLENHCPPTP